MFFPLAMKASFEPKNKEPQRCVSQKESHSAIAYPSRTFVQAKLEMTSPDDLEEQEADAVANEVINGGKIARQVSGGSGSSGIAVPRQMESRLLHSQGGGQPMPHGLRSMMESGFGQQFSQVRLHADAEAADLSSSIGAKAFTYGNDIFFNHGQYSPYSSSGQHLLAHELTHVLQQGGKVARSMSSSEKAKRQESILVNCALFRDTQLLIPLIQYLCPKADNELCACYIDALIRGNYAKTPYTDQFWGAWRGAWEENLEIFGRTGDKGVIPKKYINSDYFEKIAADHLKIIHDKMNKGRGGTSNVVEGYNRARDAYYENQRNTTMHPVVRAVENQFFKHSMEANNPSTFNPFKKPENLPDSWVYAAGLGLMFVAPVIGAAGVKVAVGAAGAWATVSTSGKIAKIISFLKSPGGRFLISTIKNSAKKGYSMLTASPEDKARATFYQEQFIELGFEILIDALDASVLKDVDVALVHDLFKNVCNELIPKLMKLSQGRDLDVNDMLSSVNSLISIGVSRLHLPKVIEKAMNVTISLLLNMLFGITIDDRSIANYDKPMVIREGSEIADFAKENEGIDIGVFSGYVGYLIALAGNSHASLNLT